MFRFIRELTKSKGPPMFLAFAVLLFASFFTTTALNGAEPAPSVGVVLILACSGAIVMKRVLLPDFMTDTSRKRNRRANSASRMSITRRSPGLYSRYSRPRLEVRQFLGREPGFGAAMPLRT